MIFEPSALKSFTSYNQWFFCTKVCLQKARLFFAQFWRCALEKYVLIQDQLGSVKDIERVGYHQGLIYILEIIRTELTTKKTRELVIKKYYKNL